LVEEQPAPAHSYGPLEEALGYTFKRPALLEQALTHRSYVNEAPGITREGTVREDNERLEFLGDAVLDLAISHVLMQRFPQRAEGELTITRAALVSEVSLHEVAAAIGLGEWLFVGKGEEQTGGRRKASLLADAFEAVIAAVFLDGGFAESELVVRRLFERALLAAGDRRQDHKTRLQERVQAKLKEAPRYLVRAETGPDHDKRFHVVLTIGGTEYAEGDGRSKKEAEQLAAQRALARLDED
jgi:ribonuclease-3